jgi:hypothetical protein
LGDRRFSDITNLLEQIMEKKELPAGSVQALSSAAIGLFAVLIAFVGYEAFSSKQAGATPWKLVDLLYMVPAGLASISLVSVPILCTSPRESSDIDRSPRLGRLCFAAGAFFVIFTLIAFFALDFLAH